MKCLLLLSASLLLANAGTSMRWFEVQPAKDAKDARLDESHIKQHWESFKSTHCKWFIKKIMMDIICSCYSVHIFLLRCLSSTFVSAVFLAFQANKLIALATVRPTECVLDFNYCDPMYCEYSVIVSPFSQIIRVWCGRAEEIRKVL